MAVNLFPRRVQSRTMTIDTFHGGVEVSLADGRHSCTDMLSHMPRAEKNVTVQKAPKYGALTQNAALGTKYGA